MCEEMKTLVSRFAEYIRRSEQQLQCFPEYKIRVEGWFKGELICFLYREKREGRLHDFRKEESGDDESRKRTDIVLQFGKSSPVSWVELKHWHIGTPNDADFGCRWYFTIANHDSGVNCNVRRLLKIPNGDKFMLVLLTANPGSKKWNSGVKAFNTNTKFSPLSVRSLTNPDDYPDYFFLGLLHVAE